MINSMERIHIHLKDKVVIRVPVVLSGLVTTNNERFLEFLEDKSGMIFTVPWSAIQYAASPGEEEDGGDDGDDDDEDDDGPDRPNFAAEVYEFWLRDEDEPA